MILVKNLNTHHTVSFDIMTPKGRDSITLNPSGRTTLQPGYTLIAGEAERHNLQVESLTKAEEAKNTEPVKIPTSDAVVTKTDAQVKVIAKTPQ